MKTWWVEIDVCLAIWVLGSAALGLEDIWVGLHSRNWDIAATVACRCLQGTYGE